MGEERRFQICLENPSAVYFSGQTVSGYLEVQENKPKKCRGIVVKFKGEAEVRWSERKSSTRRRSTASSTVTYSAKETYFNMEHVLLGNTGSEIILPAGNHIFPFSVVLPPGLPLSFEGEFGHVRYTIKAVMDRPWKFDHEAKAIFTVIQHLDLNTEFQCQERVQLCTEKYTCCLCCRSGPILLSASVPVTGYVSGQGIPISVGIDNATNKEINVVSHLVQTISYHATTKTRRRKTKLSKVDFGRVSRHGAQVWDRCLMVPSIPPSYLKNCNIIEISYKLEVEACIPGFHINLTGEIPIVIGTIPLVSLSQPSVVNQNAIQPSAPSENPPPYSPYSDIHPPTYEECMQGAEYIGDGDNTELSRHNSEFAPRYPVYRFN